ncbi:MAG: DEAD/DEAH box helicase, partial [Nitrospira sp.]|nr:DEAD/DEAH box helicase [Nitrospira sp.]
MVSRSSILSSRPCSPTVHRSYTLTVDDLTRQLSEQFGFAKFRPGQEEVVRAVLAGRDAMTVMPTGQGKSLCYQLPATLLPGLTLVISPLIAL